VGGSGAGGRGARAESRPAAGGEVIQDEAIRDAIEAHHEELSLPAGSDLDARALLAAICGNETAWGDPNWRWKAPHEPAFDRGGRYYWGNRMDIMRYGDLAARSWGPWQTMYPVARELGFLGHPWDLNIEARAVSVLIDYLNRRTFVEWPKAPKGSLVAPARSVRDVGDSYNTGSMRDTNHNPKYEADLEANYARALAFYRTGATP